MIYLELGAIDSWDGFTSIYERGESYTKKFIKKKKEEKKKDYTNMKKKKYFAVPRPLLSLAIAHCG